MPALADRCFLALDQGGHASRAVLFASDGRVVARAESPVATFREGDRVEHDPEALIESLRLAIGATCSKLPAGAHIAAAGLATQRSSMVCWDRGTGEALSPVISWQDRRNATWLDGLQTEAALIRARTGLVVSPHYGASKMRWCLDHLPAVGAAAKTGALVMGPLSSFIASRLTGAGPYADPANASRTLLWDPAIHAWSPELLGLFGIDAGMLPEAVTSRHRHGTLATPAGPVPLTVVTGDQSAMPYAFGLLETDTAYVNLGTGAFIQRPVRGRLPEAPGLLVSVVWSEAGACDFMLEGTVNGAGSALDWLSAREGIPVDQLLRLAHGASATEPEAALPVFLNGVSGLGAPWWVSTFPSRFVDEAPGTGAADRARAVLESIAFLLVTNLEELRAHGPIARLRITGGLSASDGLCRALAVLAETPSTRSLDPEATVRGLARLVAGPDGSTWPIPAAEAINVEGVTSGERSRLRERFAHWQAAMASELLRR